MPYQGEYATGDALSELVKSQAVQEFEGEIRKLDFHWRVGDARGTGGETQIPARAISGCFRRLYCDIQSVERLSGCGSGASQHSCCGDLSCTACDGFHRIPFPVLRPYANLKSAAL